MTALNDQRATRMWTESDNLARSSRQEELAASIQMKTSQTSRSQLNNQTKSTSGLLPWKITPNNSWSTWTVEETLSRNKSSSISLGCKMEQAWIKGNRGTHCSSVAMVSATMVLSLCITNLLLNLARIHKNQLSQVKAVMVDWMNHTLETQSTSQWAAWTFFQDQKSSTNPHTEEPWTKQLTSSTRESRTSSTISRCKTILEMEIKIVWLTNRTLVTTTPLEVCPTKVFIIDNPKVVSEIWVVEQPTIEPAQVSTKILRRRLWKSRANNSLGQNTIISNKN